MVGGPDLSLLALNCIPYLTLIPECEETPKSAGCLLPNGGFGEIQGLRKEGFQWYISLFHPSGNANTDPL